MTMVAGLLAWGEGWGCENSSGTKAKPTAGKPSSDSPTITLAQASGTGGAPLPPASGKTVTPSLVQEMNGPDPANWQTADGWSNGNPFNNGWRADHVTFRDGIMAIQLDDSRCPAACSTKPYASGEFRSKQFYGYGILEGRFKAAKGDGIITSLFFYTGPIDGNPWDEIDVEILGKDPTKMQVNYYTNGAGNHETMIDLGFDASAGFHTYAIKWEKNKITWLVDGRVVHTENGSRGPLPTHPGKIMANLWPGIGVDSWLKPFRYKVPVSAQYDWVRFTPASENVPIQAKIETPAAPSSVGAITQSIVSSSSNVQGYNGIENNITVKNGKIVLTGDIRGNDAGFFVEFNPVKVEGNKYLVVDIKGKVTQQQGWAKYASIQIVDSEGGRHILEPLCQSVWDDCRKVTDISGGAILKLKLPAGLKEDIARFEMVFIGETQVANGFTVSNIGLAK